MTGYLAALVLGGVLAAVAGDWLGHRLGRRRIVLFRLRPRHSGLLGTGVAGGAVGLLAGFGLWAAGAFTGPGEPVFVKVPVPRVPPVRTAASVPTPGPQPAVTATPEPAAASPSADPALLARLQQAETRVRELEAATRQAKPVPAATLPPVLVARRGEALCVVDVPGGQVAEVAERAVSQVLSLVKDYGVRRGAAPGLQVPAGQLADAGRTLQSVGAYRLQVVAARHVLPGEPLAVQLSVRPMPVESLAELQERSRFEGLRAGSPGQGNPALTSVAAADPVTDLPASSYVTLPETHADSSLKLVWRDDPGTFGPLRLQLGTVQD